MNEQTTSTEGNEQLSMFHEGSNQIGRINEILLECKRHSSNGLFKNWKISLDCFFRELSSDILDLEKGKEYYDYHLTGLQNDLEKIHKENRTDKKKERQLVYITLQKWEIQLRQLQKIVGKGGKYFDNSARDLE